MGKNRFDKYTYGLISGFSYDFTDKQTSINNHITYMLSRTQSMFKYNNLPDTIPERIIELYLQTNGHCCLTKIDNKFYVFIGSMGGEPDVYLMPTLYTISNPALKISKNLKIDDECVVIPSDSLYIGLMPMFQRYATAIVENELSMNLSCINSRIISLISSGDDRTTKSAEKFLNDIYNGKPGVIAENNFLDGIKTQPYATTNSSNSLTTLIEYEQYLKASWYNELGLNANNNMKRESINSGESQLNNDMLSPFVDDMFKCRKKAIEKINEMYNLDISVELNSSWEDNKEEIEIEHENISGQPEKEMGDYNE